jgi:chorismate mutase
MNVTVKKIDHIKEMLEELSEERLTEVMDFVAFLREREQKHRAFEERILKIEGESDTIVCSSVEEAM